MSTAERCATQTGIVCAFGSNWIATLKIHESLQLLTILV